MHHHGNENADRPGHTPAQGCERRPAGTRFRRARTTRLRSRMNPRDESARRLRARRREPRRFLDQVRGGTSRWRTCPAWAASPSDSLVRESSGGSRRSRSRERMTTIMRDRHDRDWQRGRRRAGRAHFRRSAEQSLRRERSSSNSRARNQGEGCAAGLAGDRDHAASDHHE